MNMDAILLRHSGSAAKAEKLLTPRASFVALSSREISGWNSFKFLGSLEKANMIYVCD